MSTLDLEHIADTPPEPTGPTRSASALDRVRRLYQQAESEQVLDLPVPRNPIMQVRYRAIDPDEFDSTGRAPRDRNLDLLIAACQAILIEDNGHWEPLTHAGEPVRFDETLSEILGLGVPSADDGGTAREVALRVFSRAPSPHLAVAVHVERLSDWMAGDSSLVDEESLLGES